MNDTDRDAPTSMSAARRAAARSQLVAVVDGRESARPRLPRSVLVAAVVVVGAAASVGAVGLLTQAPVTDPYLVECRATLDPDEQGNQIATTTPVAVVDGVTREQPRPELANAISICAQLIRAGWPTAPPGQMTFDERPLAPGSVPDMTLCVAEDGHAVVVPSGDGGVCAQLGLSAAPA